MTSWSSRPTPVLHGDSGRSREGGLSIPFTSGRRPAHDPLYLHVRFRIDGATKMHAELPANLVTFCGRLRRRGMRVGVGEERDALRALTFTPIADPELFRECLQITLAKSKSDRRVFDEEYSSFFVAGLQSGDKQVDAGDARSEAPPKPTVRVPEVFRIRRWLDRNREPEDTADAAVYSPDGAGSRRDYGRIPEHGWDEILSVSRKIARALKAPGSRRRWRSSRRGRLDIRRTVRLNLRRGGELMELAYRERKAGKPRAVMLCDVSRSMNPYHPFMIQFMIALSKSLPQLKVYLFGTTLRDVTREVRALDFGSTWRSFHESSAVWLSGTRIGWSLREFLHAGGQNSLDGNTTVFIVSDGWDTGEIELLERSMREIRRRAGLVIWLNALLASPTYEPSCAGMRAALPHIDHFAAGHDIESLRALAGELKKGRHK